MELWDCYTADFKVVDGITMIRGEKIPDGYFHLVVDILVKHIDGSYLLMKRHPEKNHGGMWEATAGGSALKGETPYAAALRELYEETGIRAEKLTELGHFVQPERHALYADFLCLTDITKDSVTLQDGETVDYIWVTHEELCSMTREELISDRMQKIVAEFKDWR